MPALVRPPSLPNLGLLHVRFLANSRVKDTETQEQASQKDWSTGALKEPFSCFVHKDGIASL